MRSSREGTGARPAGKTERKAYNKEEKLFSRISFNFTRWTGEGEMVKKSLQDKVNLSSIENNICPLSIDNYYDKLSKILRILKSKNLSLSLKEFKGHVG